MRQHENGKGARYTKMHKPKKLVHVEEFYSRAEAMKREKRIKRLNRREKLKLASIPMKVARRLKRRKAA